MKKFLALILAMLMMMSMATTAMAETVNAEGGSSTTTVKGTCVEGTSESPITYSVDISWDDLSFTYNEENAPTWNPTTHKYNGDKREAGWVDKTATATITNHSNTAIMATFSYQANSGYETAGMQFGAGDVYVASAEDGSQKTVTNTVKPTGYLPKNTNDAEIGTITVTIAKAADVSSNDADYLQSKVATEVTSMKMGSYLSSSYETYTVVSDASTLASGAKYILQADVDALEAASNAYGETLRNNPSQAERNAAYYEMKATWDNFNATKLQTKA